MVAGGALRVVFFGTPAFAVPTLEALLRSRHQVVGVVTQPDRPRGRGQQTSASPVKAVAVSAGLPVLQPERLKDPAFLDSFSGLGAELGVVAAYGRILTDAVLAIPPRGLINVHASLLPRYRGAAPVHRAIIAGERETGVTIMRVVKALDAGAMIATVRRPIGPDDTSDEVEKDLGRLGADLLVDTTDALAAGTAVETPQDDTAATYAHRLTKDDGIIDWSRPADEVHNLVRGLHPWPHAYSFHHGSRFILLRSTVVAAAAGGGTDAPGTIIEAHGDRLIVATGRGRLQAVQIQAEGKRPMGVRDFLAGHHFKAGERFTSGSQPAPNPQPPAPGRT